MRIGQHKDPIKIHAKRKALNAVLAIFPLVLFLLYSGTNAFSLEKDFFSYKRFFIREDALSSGKGQGLVQRDLEDFVQKFNEGLYFFSANNYVQAEKSLQKARVLWPEYYATDLLLARAYEENGEYKKAARYYKSYLKKLNKLRSGSYRLTGPLMISFNSGDIESYNDAYMYIGKRLERYGINIDNVVPAFDPPGALLFVIVWLGILSGITALYYRLRPYLRIRKRIRNTPEGFWACRKCGIYNPELRHECEECGRSKPGSAAGLLSGLRRG